MPSHSLTKFEIQKYYQCEPKFKGVYSRNNLSKIKDGPHIINLDECESIGTHCIALYVNGENITLIVLEWNIFQKINIFKIYIEYNHMIQ